MESLLLKWVRIFLPTPCIGCGELQGRIACEVCVSRVARMDRSVRSRDVDQIFCYFLYQGLVKSLIHRCKFGPSIEAAEEISRLVARHSPIVDFSRYRWVVSVPGSRSRINTRGFSLPELVFRPLIRLSPILVRQRETRPLFDLTPVQRIAELEAVFDVVDDCISPGDSVLIVDDILTTGATAAAVATLCRNAGATHVDLLVIAAVETELNDSN